MRGRHGATARAWAELLRISALFTVPGDAVAGAAASGLRLNRGTALAVGSSLCLYEAGMALNDYADRHVDAVERPGRPLPSGRITPPEALAASGALTAAGLGMAAAVGPRTLLTATALAGTVWAYDLGLKHTRSGPAAMAAARALDLVLGAAATAESAPGAGSAARRVVARPGAVAIPRTGAALRSGAETRSGARTRRGGRGGAARAGARRDVLRAAGLLGTHTFVVTSVSRRETLGASPTLPLVALSVVGLVASSAAGFTGGHETASAGGLTGGLTRPVPPEPAPKRPAPRRPTPKSAPRRPVQGTRPWSGPGPAAAVYAATAASPLVRAVSAPTPALLQRAVGGGIRATVPLQAALAARAGRPAAAAAVLALLPAAVRLSRKVSPT